MSLRSLPDHSVVLNSVLQAVLPHLEPRKCNRVGFFVIAAILNSNMVTKNSHIPFFVNDAVIHVRIVVIQIPLSKLFGSKRNLLLAVL